MTRSRASLADFTPKRTQSLILALGTNRAGPWGRPYETMNRARQELDRAGLRVIASSRIYATTPLGPGRQAAYLNAVLILKTHCAPAALLRLLKHMERRAGRRLAPHWGPRCLDLDVLDYGGRRIGWQLRRRERGRLVLPHPEIHKRAFVLIPLLEAVPRWYHPVLGMAGTVLLARLGLRERRGVLPVLDFAPPVCDKKAT
jgi:2-amino-4-hydroxy-6-hydroxymethyldihydropteridine diphosphokinase